MGREVAGRTGTTGKGGDSSHETQDDLMLANCAEPESPSSSLHGGDLRGWWGCLESSKPPPGCSSRRMPGLLESWGPGLL